ncbi:hypothetical protein IEQ11_15705 [Lysobacter capsici]|uniref:hypothetical protein n=1 Tax=Lysobacter capsici TaxID=435897 RepID=UPI00177E9244|nr:hypothetical protein [Lysobacter capsici]UOF13192.1 hypothetical protein IEQ11_15705 [Lysobacter capsici]
MKRFISAAMLGLSMLVAMPAFAEIDNPNDPNPTIVSMTFHNWVDGGGLSWSVTEYRWSDGSITWSDPTRTYQA